MSNEHENTMDADNAQDQRGRTFSQIEVDAIVGKRLADERRKNEAAIAEKERDISAREHRMYTTETMKTKGLPEYLLEAIRGDDKEGFDASMAVIERYIQEHHTAPFKEAVAAAVLERITPSSIPKHPRITRQPTDTIRQGMGLT